MELEWERCLWMWWWSGRAEWPADNWLGGVVVTLQLTDAAWRWPPTSTRRDVMFTGRRPRLWRWGQRCRWWLVCCCLYTVHRVSIKNKQNYFCYNYVRLPPNLTIFGTKMANGLELHEVHSFTTSPNSCQCTTVLNADVPNCYITLQA